jgi:hypothetical protein
MSAMDGLVSRCYYDIAMSKIMSQLVCVHDDINNKCKLGDVIGKFSLNMYNPFELKVYIDDNFKGLGLSTVLLQNFAEFLGKPDREGIYNVVGGQEGVEIKIALNENVFLAIDIDASANERGKSWWGKIGMVNNRHCNSTSSRCIDITGYAKIITLKDLLITIAKMKDKRYIYFGTTVQQSMQKRQKTKNTFGGKSKKGIKNK